MPLVCVNNIASVASSVFEVFGMHLSTPQVDDRNNVRACMPLTECYVSCVVVDVVVGNICT